MRISSYLPVLLATLPATPTYAYGVAGHQIVATIAQIFLTPAARNQLCDILPELAKCHLAPFAAWADQVRNPSTAPLHFVGGKGDWPPHHCSFGENGWDNPERNVFVGVLNSTWGVQSKHGQERDFALRYLIHFMGDLHMPLHLSGRDRGGNEDRVRFEHQITNLHSVWDGKLISQSLRTITNYTEPLPSRRIESALRGTIYDPYVRWITWEGILGWWKSEYETWASCPSSTPLDPTLERISHPQPDTQLIFPNTNLDPHISALQSTPLDPSLPVCPYDWARPIHDTFHCVDSSSSSPKSNMSYIWPPHLSLVEPGTPPHHYPANELVELDTKWYRGRLRDDKVIEKMLAMGGIRLAGILNEVLDPIGAQGVRVKWA